MRENKYKVWDSENKKWYEPIFEHYKGNLEYLVLNPGGDLSMMTMDGMVHESMFPDRFKIVFFTGLKDKDGRERYEHDIYEVRVNGTKTHVEYVICVVRWADASTGFGFKKIDSDSEIPEWMGMLDPNIISIKYLGNIHEHSELIK